jgi:hypothetical protein
VLVSSTLVVVLIAYSVAQSSKTRRDGNPNHSRAKSSPLHSPANGPWQRASVYDNLHRSSVAAKNPENRRYPATWDRGDLQLYSWWQFTIHSTRHWSYPITPAPN